MTIFSLIVCLVVFEDLYYQDKVVAVHADITDEDQTVWFPEIRTTAVDKKDGDKEVVSEGKVRTGIAGPFFCGWNSEDLRKFHGNQETGT